MLIFVMIVEIIQTVVLLNQFRMKLVKLPMEKVLQFI